MNFHRSQVVLGITQVPARQLSTPHFAPHYAPLDHGLKENSVLPEYRFTCFFLQEVGLIGVKGRLQACGGTEERKKMFDSWLTNGDWSSSLTRNPPCNRRTHLPIRQGGGSVSRDTESGNLILSRNLLQKLLVMLFLLQMHTSSAFSLPLFSLASCRFLKRIKSQNNFNWKYIPIKGRRKYILMVPK